MSTDVIDLAGRRIGPGEKPFVIAEVAQAHDGSLGAAHAYIDLAARCGADAIKFQTHIARAESTREEPFRVKFSRQDTSRYDYWKRMEFSAESWARLAKHAQNADLIFLSSPFSIAALELLDKLEIEAWKVASGEIGNNVLLDAMMATNKPILLSSGMSSWAALDAAVAYLDQGQGRRAMALFQCTTKYPTPFEEVGLNILAEMRARYNCPVGLSDHSADVLPSIAAMALGADLIEVHICLHRDMFGPDTCASLDPDQLKELCHARDAIHTMHAHPVNKDDMAAELEDTGSLFSRSLALREDQTTGTVLEQSMLTPKKPGTGIPFDEASDYVGRRLSVDVHSDRLLRPEDFEEE